jgi:hypothetical protein
MTIKRITVSVPETTARRIKAAAGTVPVSTWVTEVIEEHLDDAELDRQWAAFLAEVAPAPADVRRAEAKFRRLTKGSRRRRAA